MNITIDGNTIDFFDSDKTIIEAADRAGIRIPAPCYRDENKHDCCYACVVEVNGEKKYACAVKPEDGMKIIFKRDDLHAIRKDRMEQYTLNGSQCCGGESHCDCDGECDCNDDCDCGCHTDKEKATAGCCCS